MSIRSFSKMHGLGNDFIVLNALQQPFDWPRARHSAPGRPPTRLRL